MRWLVPLSFAKRPAGGVIAFSNSGSISPSLLSVVAGSRRAVVCGVEGDALSDIHVNADQLPLPAVGVIQQLKREERRLCCSFRRLSFQHEEIVLVQRGSFGESDRLGDEIQEHRHIDGGKWSKRVLQHGSRCLLLPNG